MPAYPTTPAWSYPVIRTLQFATRIGRGEDGTEQRWSLHTGKESWALTYPRLTLVERDDLLTFFEASKGAFDHTFDFTFNGTTYAGCHFDADKLQVIERDSLSPAAVVTIRQANRAADVESLPADFPVLTSGARMQRPYTYERGFDTKAVSTEGGRFAWYRRAASLRVWSAGGPSLSDADAAAIWSMFSLARGRWASFHFTDPDSSVEYTSCRFAEDQIERRYVEPAVNVVEVQIEQFV